MKCRVSTSCAILLISLGLGSCHEPAAIAPSPQLPTAIRREPWCPAKPWKLLNTAIVRCGRPERNPKETGYVGEVLSRLIATELSPEETDALIEAFGDAASVRSGMSENGTLLAECTVIALGGIQHDRQKLAKMLGMHYPALIGTYYTEWYVADFGIGADPVLVLGEAYTGSKREEVKRGIADAWRRAFGPMGVKGDTDDSFIRECVRWYAANKRDFKIRVVYPDDGKGLFVLTK